MLRGLGRLHQDSHGAVHAGRAAMGKGSFAVFAINEAAVFEVAKRQANRDAADVEFAAKLVFARDGEGGLLVFIEDLFGQRSNQAGTGCGRTLGRH